MNVLSVSTARATDCIVYGRFEADIFPLLRSRRVSSCKALLSQLASLAFHFQIAVYPEGKRLEQHFTFVKRSPRMPIPGHNRGWPD